MSALSSMRPCPRPPARTKKRCSPVSGDRTHGSLGVRFDSATGLFYMRQRWFSSELQRFISRDPIGLQGGDNLYSYCNNSPVCHVDPSGLDHLDDLLSLLKCDQEAAVYIDAFRKKKIWKVDFVNNLVDRKTKVDGLTDRRRHRISIESANLDESQAATLIHEILHVLINERDPIIDPKVLELNDQGYYLGHTWIWLKERTILGRINRKCKLKCLGQEYTGFDIRQNMVRDFVEEGDKFDGRDLTDQDLLNTYFRNLLNRGVDLRQPTDRPVRRR